MPAPILNFVPRNRNGSNAPGFDRRGPAFNAFPSEQRGWSPAPQQPWPRVTEPGGGMVKVRSNSMSGMGDIFEYPQGTDPSAFYAQQVASGAMPPPPPGSPASGEAATPFMINEAEEAGLFTGGGRSMQAGSMAWESGMAPWEQVPPVSSPSAMAPDRAEAAVSSMNARRRAAGNGKAVEAAKAAKIAADNAVRAAVAGAPQVAATNAATAQAAANVAAGAATSIAGQQAAAVAQSEATKAVAAANVAAANATGQGMAGMRDWMELSGMGSRGYRNRGVGDWMELSGMRGLGAGGGAGFMDQQIAGPVQVKHVVYGGLAAAVGFFGYRYLTRK